MHSVCGSLEQDCTRRQSQPQHDPLVKRMSLSKWQKGVAIQHAQTVKAVK